MELVQGVPITRYCDEQRLDLQARLNLFVAICKAVQHAHLKGIIHRDLKLGNLFIDDNMCMKIGDFGLATKLSFPTERKRTVCGTPNYIAPEILEGKDGHSFEVDIWSIGVIIYTMIVGRPPFECKDVKSTYKKILANSYTYPELIPVSDVAKAIIQEILQVRISVLTK